jgi:hypothetical protein
MKLKHNIAISESGFVFDAVSGDSFSLNPVALEIIELLKNHNSYEQIRDHFLEKYDVDAPVFEKTFYDFLGMLKHFNLLDNGEEN